MSAKRSSEEHAILLQCIHNPLTRVGSCAIDIVYTVKERMHAGLARRQSGSSLGTNAFDSEMLEAARIYHLQLAHGQAKGYMPVEVAAFIAGACWAKQVIVAEGKVK
jgi:hypothetical protein